MSALRQIEMSPLVKAAPVFLFLQTDSGAWRCVAANGEHLYARTGSAQMHSGIDRREIKQKPSPNVSELTVRQLRRLAERYGLRVPRSDLEAHWTAR